MKKKSTLHKSVTQLIVPTLLLFFSCKAFSQTNEIVVNGKVSNDSAIIQGVTVQLKGYSQAANTDKNGYYTIYVPANGILVFSIVGYEQQEVAINGRSTVNVLMKRLNNQLEDVVV